MLLVHNHDTSIKTFAKLLNDQIKKIPNIHGYDELELCNASSGRNIVSLTVKSLAQDIDSLLKKLNNETNNPLDLFPQIIVSQSSSISPSAFGRTMKKFQMKDIIKLVNKEDPEDTLTLAGQMFTYETPVQIVILTRSNHASKELALHTWNILANNEKIKYSLLLKDEVNNKNHVVEDYGHLRLVGVKSASFSDASTVESGVVAVAMDFTMREQFFMLRDSEQIATKYRVDIKILNHQVG
jgi:hypothetical protein